MRRTAAPAFWHRASDHPGLMPRLLEPLGWGYAAAGAARRALVRPWRAPVPVICVGNLVAGGAGKTPVALSLAETLRDRGTPIHFLTRGYGGALAGPLAVDPARHDFRVVGDEALLLAAAAPTWVAHDRVAGARAAIAAGARRLVLDDGFQNPCLVQDLRLLVIDGDYGLGNGRVIPAGPLREPARCGLARADAVVLLGEDRAGLDRALGRRLPVLRASLAPVDGIGDGAAGGTPWAGRRLLAFAGIGRPAKFFATLERLGAVLVARHGFADHHPYSPAELDRLLAEAAAAGAEPVTTAKDWVRLPPERRQGIAVLRIAVAWREPAALQHLLDRVAPPPALGA